MHSLPSSKPSRYINLSALTNGWARPGPGPGLPAPTHVPAGPHRTRGAPSYSSLLAATPTGVPTCTTSSSLAGCATPGSLRGEEVDANNETALTHLWNVSRVSRWWSDFVFTFISSSLAVCGACMSKFHCECKSAGIIEGDPRPPAECTS